MGFGEGSLLVAGGLVAGVLNTLAGGGSLLTVPILVIAGVPGNAANGSNRVGILFSNASAVAAFRHFGVYGISKILPIAAPVVIGSLVGALLVSQLADENFERIFGIVMIPILLLSLRSTKFQKVESPEWSISVTVLIFFCLGVYGGAFQAGIGLLLIAALSRSGMDLINANNVKVIVILLVTFVALPVFIISGQIVWGPAVVLAVGFSFGGVIGARLTVVGGERLVRPVMAVAVLALSGRLIGIY